MTAPKAEPIAEIPARILAAQLNLTAAWERVSAKAGMPGVDGLSTSRFAKLMPAALSILEQRFASGEYRAMPLRLAEMEKKDGRRRRLLVPAVADRVAQGAAAAWLGAKWDATFDAASFAYRPGRGVHAALRYMRDLRDRGYRWVFDADIQTCFDSIAHDQLFDRLAQWLGARSPMLDWIRQWTAAEVWNGEGVYRLTAGIPQGSPLSPLLSNFYLDEFDRTLRARKLAFVRYADDFLVLTKSPFEMNDARAIVAEALGLLGLQLNALKTRTTSFDQWFRFLGAELQGDAILLPFEKIKTPLKPVYVAPVMPPALMRAWRAGHVKVRGPLPPPNAPAEPQRTAPRTAHQSVLDRLAGRRRPR